MKRNENNKVLLEQLEQHAKDAMLLEQCKDVIKDLKFLRIFKKKYLVLDKKK